MLGFRPVSRVIDLVEGLLAAFATRVVLSVAIIASLVPHASVPLADLVFLGLFGTEALLRAAVVCWRAAHGRWRAGDLALLALDLLATATFLPGVAASGEPLSFWIRAGRAVRLGLFLAYWGPLAKDLLAVALQRERLSQLLLVVGLVALLSSAGVASLYALHATRDESFGQLLWWSFVHVLDSGHIEPELTGWKEDAIALGLTASGLLVMAFLVGIGTTVVGDLVVAGRLRRPGLHRHTVIVNVDEQSLPVLHHIAAWLTKQARWTRVAVLGPWPERPAILHGGVMRRFAYRPGHMAEPGALVRVDTATARRVAVLASGRDAAADADAVTAALTVRSLNPAAWVVIELNRPSNIPAALRAAGGHVVAVPARRLAALVLVQELVGPGRVRFFEDLLSLEGQELYTAVYGDGQLEDVPAPLTIDVPFGDLRRQILHSHGCLLIGWLADPRGGADSWNRERAPVLNPDPSVRPGRIYGLVAVARRFEDLRQAAAAVARAAGAPPARPAASPLALNPVARPDLHRVAVLGFHDDTVEMVASLMDLFPSSAVTVVGRDEAERHRMRRAFLDERIESGAHFQEHGPKALQLCQADGSRCGIVEIRVADRYTEALYRPGSDATPVGNVFDYDAVILLADWNTGKDPDAASVMGVLKLLEHWDESSKQLRVVAETVNRDLAALLRSRVRAIAPGAPITFVRTMELRQQILSHSFFVPGLPPVLRNLLTAGREEIVVYELPQGAELTFGGLVDGMTGTRQVPIGVEDKEGRLHLNPPPDQRFGPGEVRFVYALAQLRALTA